MSRRHVVAVILTSRTAVGGIVIGCTAEAETRAVAPVAVAPVPSTPRPLLVPPPPDPLLAFPPRAMLTPPPPSPAARPVETTKPTTTSSDDSRSGETQRRRNTEQELRERARTLTNDDLRAGRGSMPDGGLTSGESQFTYGCEQGYIPASECN